MTVALCAFAGTWNSGKIKVTVRRMSDSGNTTLKTCEEV
jgi:hypothetical protein